MSDLVKTIEAKTKGRYQLNEQIGSGAAGAVFRALDKKFDRSVIIKVLHKVSSKNSFRRFKAEAKALSRLDHENIVRLYDHIPDDQLPSIVLEDVEGKSLRDLDADRDFTVTELVEYIASCASGLEAAHEEKIIHRDIKPENIIVTPQGTPKLIDFGLALDVQSEAKTRMTATGAVVGTIYYMAPEILRGGQANQTSDVFALGVTLFEMLTGYFPYHNVKLTDLLHSAKFCEPDLQLLPNEVNDELKSILAKMVAFTPEGRLPNARVARRRLYRWLGRSVSSHSQAKPIVKRQSQESDLSLSRPTSVKRSLLPTVFILLLTILVGTYLWHNKPQESKKAREGLTNKKRLQLEQRIIDIRQKVLSANVNDLELMLATHCPDLGKTLAELHYWRRLKLPKGSNELDYALVYLVRYSKEKTNDLKRTATLYKYLFDQLGIKKQRFNAYVNWAGNNGKLREAAKYLHTKMDEVETDTLRQATISLSKTCVKKAEMRTPNSRKAKSASTAFEPILLLYKNYLPGLPDKDFRTDFKYYISFLSACSGRSYQDILKKTRQWLAHRSELCWSCRRLLAEALCLDFETTVARTKMAINLQRIAIKEAPQEEKLRQEAFLTILYSRLCYDHTDANRMDEAIATVRKSLRILREIILKAKGKKDHSLILCYYIDCMSTSRFLADKNAPSVKTIEDTFKLINKSDLKDDEQFLYHLALSIVARERSEIVKAEQHLFDCMELCPTHWHNNLILRMTNLSFLKGIDLLSGKR